MTESPLEGRTIYMPPMSYSGVSMLAAAFRSIGVDAKLTPKSNQETLELGGRYTSGEECLPEKVTLGDILRVTRQEGFDPKKTAYLMPTADGPCRFGQYRSLLRKVLDDLGYQDILLFSPSSADGYQGFGENAAVFIRTAWRAVLIGDLMTKALLRTRPYETEKGAADAAFEASLKRMGDIAGEKYTSTGQQMKALIAGLRECRRDFEAVPADYSEPRLLIGVVGEIFCRLNDYSNSDTIRKLEEYGCEAWLSDVAEWMFYTNDEVFLRLNDAGKGWWHPAMWKARLQNYVQHREEHQIYSTFDGYFVGVEEPESIRVILDASEPYLPQQGALGEMVLSTGKAIFAHGRGADGIVDISPFTCMNGIVTQAVYTKVSQDHDDIPIRSFFFDGISADLDRDVGIFAELARAYSKRKKHQRKWKPPVEAV